MSSIPNTYRNFCITCINQIHENIQKNNEYNIGLELGYLEMIIRNQPDLDELMPPRSKAFVNSVDNGSTS